MRRRVRPSDRVLGRVFGFLSLGLGFVLLSAAFAPAVSYALLLLACALIGHGMGLPDTTGLSDHRQ